jgi:hypothetical protein
MRVAARKSWKSKGLLRFGARIWAAPNFQLAGGTFQKLMELSYLRELFELQLEASVSERTNTDIGSVLTIGDGIARVAGMQECMAGELLEFAVPAGTFINNGQRPAINIGISVSRVGSAAQPKAMKQVAGHFTSPQGRAVPVAAVLCGDNQYIAYVAYPLDLFEEGSVPATAWI